MPEGVLVINTGPLIALVAAMGDLRALTQLYKSVIVPREVYEEVCLANPCALGADVVKSNAFLNVVSDRIELNTALGRLVDRGEASVIQTALDRQVQTVCIDEKVGRRVARLHRLNVTGSLGIMLKYKQQCADFSVAGAITAMESHGIYLSRALLEEAMRLAREDL